jgi:hypothetical protein
MRLCSTGDLQFLVSRHKPSHPNNQPFVIPTGGQRSGGTCGSGFRITNHHVPIQPTLCHPDRSAAQWRDLQFPVSASQPSRPEPTYPLSSRPERSAVEGPAVPVSASQTITSRSNLPFVIPTRAQRSGGTCGSGFRITSRLSHRPDRRPPLQLRKAFELCLWFQLLGTSPRSL